MEIERKVLEDLLNGSIKPEDFKYRRFTISPNRYYAGEEYIYAENIEEAKKIMNSYIHFDKSNEKNTGGFGYIIEDSYLSNEKSPIYENQKEFDEHYYNGIYYVG